MTLTPPFTLSGEAGKALGNVGYSLAALGVQDAVLNLRSLDADTLQFSLRDNGSRPAIPDDGQWLTLRDDTNTILFTGIAKRTFRFPERIYTYECANVYQGMMETNLLSNGRPFITYFADDAAFILGDILARAADVGLAVQAGDFPELFTIPKMSFRASSYAGAVEDVLKWLPDVTSRMDYSTTPPTLLFQTRASAPEKVIDLDGESHKATALELTPYPEIRALAVDFSYAKRVGEKTVEVLSQTAGDPVAAGIRKISLFISGAERMDAFIAEALVTAQDAKAMALTLGGVSSSTSPSLVPDWNYLKTNNASLAAAVVAEPGFVMDLVDPRRRMYDGYMDEFLKGRDYFESRYGGFSKSLAISLTSGGAVAAGWYAITASAAAAWTTEELAAIGVTKRTGYFGGDLFWESRYHGNVTASAGCDSLAAITASRAQAWHTGGGVSIRTLWFRVAMPVTIIDAAPSTVSAALAANNTGYSLDFIERAEYVDVPDDLAANYFTRQDWTPYKGRLTLTPTAPDFPAPGDFLNILGTGTPAEWQTMKVPVSELSIDLRTGAATVAIGPSTRMDFSSLVDRLRIPPEDNYQPG